MNQSICAPWTSLTWRERCRRIAAKMERDSDPETVRVRATLFNIDQHFRRLAAQRERFRQWRKQLPARCAQVGDSGDGAAWGGPVSLN